MTSVKYIEIDSTYRNRVQWPEPGDFEVPLSVNGRKKCSDSVDPVSLSAPKLYWRSNRFDANAAGSTSTVTANLVTTGSTSVIVEEINVGDFQKGAGDLRDQYYEGAIITSGSYTGIITKWETLTTGNGTEPMRVAVSLSQTITLATGSVLTITDPTIIGGGAADGSNPAIFVPRGSKEDNSFISYYLYNDTRNEGRKVFYYDGTNRLIGVDTTNGNLVPTWTASDSYSLRKEMPALCGSTFIDPAVGGGIASNISFILNTENLSNPVSSFIQLQDTTANNLVGEMRKIIKYFNTSGTAISGTTNTITIPSRTGAKAGDFDGLYIRITGGTSSGDTRLISKHILNTNEKGMVISETLTMLNNFTAPPDNTSVYSINSGLVSPEFTNNIAASQFCYLPCSYDNLNPLLHTMCISESNEMTCYEIELVNLILPNKLISVTTGGRLASHPYLYVRLSNSTSAGGNIKNVLYSNNPYSTYALFRAKIDDVTDLLTPFVKLSGDGTVLTIKFKPRDNFRFTVFFKNGDVFETIREETYSPLEPNPLTQISALFAIKKILNQ